MALPLAAPTVLIKPHQSLAQACVDRLGRLQAELAPLKNEEEALKSLLRESGQDVIEGDLFRATITAGKPGQKIDWEGLARSIASESRLAKLIPLHTSETPAPAPRVSVKAKKGL